MHLAVAPAGSLPLAAAVGAEADAAAVDLAAVVAAGADCDMAPEGAGVAGDAGAAAAVGLAEAGDFAAFCLPPWPLQAPRPVAVEVVPSLQVVPPELAAAGVADVAGAAELAEAEAFCLPPWPLQAPRPVAVDVVPSLQVVVAAVSSARPGTVNTNIRSGAARAPMRFLLFTVNYPHFD